MLNLFRKEFIESNRSQWTGQALLTTTIPAWLYFFISTFFIFIFIFIILKVNYNRRINVYGEISTFPRSVNVISLQQGIVSEIFVKLGDEVKKGQALYEIDVSRITEGGKVSLNTRLSIENQINNIDNIILKLNENKLVTLKNLEHQKKKYEQSHLESKKVLESVLEGVEFSRKNKISYQEYHRRGLITKEQLNAQIYSYYQQQNIFQNIQSQYIQESLQITNLTSDIVTRAADFDNQISQYKSQRNELESRLIEASANGSIIVNATTDGYVESLSVTLGQMVNNGDSLVQITPSHNSTYKLILWIPNSSIPYIKNNDSINIRYDAFPYQQFGNFSGKIESIAYVPASTQEMSTYSSSPVVQLGSKSASYYKVIVKLDNTDINYQGRNLKLTNGMLAQSTLFLEKRPIYQWMFSPFYNIKNSIIGPINEKK